MAKNFDLEQLSDREREILDLAIRGLTDQQIGNKLSITASTVNSYWVRIRGKLGHVSRTEMVSTIVQQRANVQTASQDKRIEDLENLLERANEKTENIGDSNLLREALEANPQAIIVFNEAQEIILANRRLETLFDFPTGTAVGRRFEELFSPGRQRTCEGILQRVGDRGILGLTYPVFAIRQNGRQFRVFIVIGQGKVDGQAIYSCVVRSFVVESDLARDRAAIVMGDVS